MTDFAFFNENDTFKASSADGDQKSGGEFREPEHFPGPVSDRLLKWQIPRY